ncbi:MAG: hypothetical protein KDA75_19465, partial [Planctomycetaceae bacterium]|nr:hypothetical protein [Planctomycetaceae bacterium]
MASQRSRPTRRTTRKPRPAENAVIEEFDREEELSAVDFGDDAEEQEPAPKAERPKAERPKAERPKRGRPRKKPPADDDFGADIVPEEESSADDFDDEDTAPPADAPKESNGRTAQADSTSRPGEDRGSDQDDRGGRRGRRRRRRGRGQRDGQQEQ